MIVVAKKRAKKRKKQTKRDRRAGSRQQASVTSEMPRYLQRIQEQWDFVRPILDAHRDDQGVIDWARVGEYARAETAAIEQQLVESMAPYDAFDIVANMLFFNLPRNPETYRESEHEGLLANVEYAASLCLRRPDRSGTGDREDDTVGGHVERWNEEIRRLLRLRGLGQMAGLASDDSELVGVRYEQFERELFVRNVAYEWQEERLLRLLFKAEPLAADLRRLAGVTIDEVLALADQTTHWSVEQLMSGAWYARREADAFRELIDAQRAGDPVPAPSQEQAASIAELAQLLEHELDEMTERFIVFSAWHRLGDRSSFTFDQIAEAACVSEDAALAFLELFSQPFGQDPSRDPIRALQAVRARPIMRDGERYHCVDGGDLLWAIRPRLEAVLKQDRQAWSRYDRHRATSTEQRVLELLTDLLEPDDAYQSLRWTVDDQRFELDGLLLVDRYAITIETKAGGFTEPARRT